MDASQQLDKPRYGCFFCKTGCEQTLANDLNHNIRSADFLVAQKKSRRRINGRMSEETVVLFPGYVFFRSYEDMDPALLKGWPSLLKILTNSDGSWQLVGEDYRFAEWLFAQGGIIGFSKALIIGERLRILNGPLMGHEGQIIKVNRRFQNCLVILTFEDRVFKVWLGYELISEVM